eukprot:scaffold7328_cov314-Pinguiococcus_pyrenoidosus.AAC.68
MWSGFGTCSQARNDITTSSSPQALSIRVRATYLVDRAMHQRLVEIQNERHLILQLRTARWQADLVGLVDAVIRRKLLHEEVGVELQRILVRRALRGVVA